MDKERKSEIITLLRKSGPMRVAEIVNHIAISRQAIHRHLKELEVSGRIRKLGVTPHVRYQVWRLQTPQTPIKMDAVSSQIKRILRKHPDVILVTLFGSYARGKANPNSDIDAMVWLTADSTTTRQELWDFWDRRTLDLIWSKKTSLVVTKLKQEMVINTLLLDLPEEHIVVFDRKEYFSLIKNAVIRWRRKNRATKIPAFGGKHAWRYSSEANSLDEIDFRLDLRDVA